ncbi:hypothetical protein ACWX0P_28685 [Vibrio mediterranei]
MKTLFIVRGPFGVQKTEMARAFCDDVISCWDYYEKYGENKFNALLKPKADEYCFAGVKSLMNNNVEKIAVANSFSISSDLEPFISLAKEYEYKVYVMISNNDITKESRRDAPNDVVIKQMLRLKGDTNYESAVNHFLL